MPAALKASRQPRAVDLLMRDGYIILHAAALEQCARVSQELAGQFNDTPRCEGDFYGWATTRVGATLAKAATSADLVMHPDVMAIVDHVLQPSCDCIQLNLTQAIRVHPGERAQAPHRDEEMWPQQNKAVPWLINVMWALTDFTQANGATRIWPGSHCDALDRAVDPAGSISAEMKAGSALIFLGSVTHGAGANVSLAPRDGLIVSYCLGWLKQYENQFLAYPPEVARTFPPELQRLIGYQMHRPNLGGWEGRDPIEYLGEDNPVRRGHVDALTPAIAAELKAHYGERA